jgi:hypothetical protein
MFSGSYFLFCIVSDKKYPVGQTLKTSLGFALICDKTLEALISALIICSLGFCIVAKSACWTLAVRVVTFNSRLSLPHR